MTTETKPDNAIENTENSTPETEDQSANNKVVFGPLGKYAFIAVIMVSIIVTTAIMMNKELGSAEGTIASIENEVSQMASTDADAALPEIENNAATVTTDATASDLTATSAEEAAAAVALSAETAATPEAVAAVQSSAQTTMSDTAANTHTENAVFRTSPVARQEQLDAQFQARIEAHKLEQKQHMTQMFARIKEQEAKHLDRYKSYQETQVERLREQIAIQQKMIDSLVSRNKELYELRAATVQQQQSKREEMINRI